MQRVAARKKSRLSIPTERRIGRILRAYCGRIAASICMTGMACGRAAGGAGQQALSHFSLCFSAQDHREQQFLEALDGSGAALRLC